MRQNGNKKCSQCGIEFYCNANQIDQCHCSTVILTTEQQELLKQCYDDCLCNSCLMKIEKNTDNKSKL
ncbi:cysteine-rich CWC family protein [Wandonia haliotis]|uniref:cysteine-rich CWC family protein n=1 Tax=Wandonia haliotis TaxID=574963 RepID=UPI003CD0B652